MVAEKPTQHESDQSPLEILARDLSPDMLLVNELILARMESDIPLIPQLASYLIASGGKRIRPLLTIASARLFDPITTRPYRLSAAIEFIHTATLLHDDVVDESHQRRGKASANIVFGNQASVLVGDFLFSRAFELMVEDGSLDVLRVLSHASAVIAEGEVLQLSLQYNLKTSIDQYYKVIGSKTASLFAAATEVGAIVTGQNHKVQKSLRDYGYHLGMAFQIADDILDYIGDGDALGKNIGDDFRDGKMSAPVIFALGKLTPQQISEWQLSFGKRDADDAEVNKCIGYVTESNAIEQCNMIAKQHVDAAKTALLPIQNSSMKDRILSIADYIIARNH